MITTRKKESRRSCDLLEHDLYARGLSLEALIGRQTWSIRRFRSIAESDRLTIAYVSRRTGERTRSQAVDQAMWDAARVGASRRVLMALLEESSLPYMYSSCPIGLRNSGLLPKRWGRVRRIF
jgi:hypothetical protein